MAAIDFPNSPTNGQKFTSAGITWTYNVGIGWTIDSAVVEAGSGFTFVQDTMPLPINVGDTWFDTSTAASGGTSWVAIEEGAEGSEKIWVQFSPGMGAPPYPRAFRKFSANNVVCAAGASTTLPFADQIGDTIGGVGNRTYGFFSLGSRGIYSVGVNAAWSTTWGPGILASLRLLTTVNAGNTVNSELGAQGVGPHAHGYTTNTIILDHHAAYVSTPNLEYMLTVWNYGASPITISSLAVTVAWIGER